MRRPRGRVVLALVFAALSLNAWAQVVLALLGGSENPPALLTFQAAVGAAGAAAAWGCGFGARWAPAAALGYGVVTSGMLAALPRLLALPPEARGGVWTGAAVVLAFAAGSAWHLWRVTARPGQA